MTTTPTQTVTRLLDAALEEMAVEGMTPTRIYLGCNQMIALLAEVEYFGGFRVDATINVRKRTYKGMQVIPVALEDHLFIAST